MQPSFKKLLAAFVPLSLASTALAQTGPDLLLKPWPKGRLIEAQADANFFDSGDTKEGNDFQLAIYESEGRFRLLPDQRADPRFGYSVTYFNTNTNNPALASKYVDTSAAFGFGIADFNGWIAGLTIGVGYAGAGAYDDGNAYYGKADLLIGHDIDATSSIGFVLDYDGNRSILPDVPLPGFAYNKTLDPTLQLSVGFPYCSVTWKPDKSNTFDHQLTIEVQYDIPDDGSVHVDYEIIKDFGVFAAYEARRNAFHDDSTPNVRDRILFQQRRAEIGARWTPVEWGTIEIAGGYAFSQEFNVGWDAREPDRIAKPSDEPYLRVGVEFRY